MAAHVGLTSCPLGNEAQIISGQCLCAVAAETGELIYSSDWSGDPRHTACCPDMSCHGLVVFPIKSKDGILGVMTFYLEPGTVLSEPQIHLLTSISNQVATGILNHRLFRKDS